MAARFLALSLLALACASSPPSNDSTYEVLHQGFGVRADLDGWEVYRDAESAPAMLRATFGNKQGPDDPPLFVATRDGAILTTIVQRVSGVDALTAFERLASVIATQGEITRAIRLTGSDDIFFSFRIGPRGLAAHSQGLVHAGGGQVVNLSLTSVGESASEEAFFAAVRGIELRGEDGWADPWQLRSPITGEALPGYEGGHATEDDDPFEAVDCRPGRHPLLWTTPAARGGRLYLFGSIHVGHPSFYPFAPPIEAAFEGADRLAVEVDVRAAGEMAEQMLEAGSLPHGQTLSEVVSPELYQQLGEVAAELGLPVEMFDAMSPGTAGMVLSVMPLISRGFSPADGVDQYFLERTEGKTIVEFETMTQQLALIESFDSAFLRAAIDGMKTIDEDLDALHRAWRCGDEEGLEHALLGLPRERASTAEERTSLEDFNEVFLFGRNERMAKEILDLLDEEGDTFVVVGAAHLVGERGIPALLRAAGHGVESVAP